MSEPLASDRPPLERRPILHRFRLLRLLRGSLVGGALYDLGFAVILVFAPGLPARTLSLPLPGTTFYLWIMATFLTMLAALYLVAARDPRRYSAVVVVAIGGRTVGALVFTAAAVLDPALGGLYPLAAVDLVFAVAHAAFWLPIR